MSSERVPRSYTWKSKLADAAAEGVGDSGRDMFLRIAVYSGRCGCPSGISSGTGPGLGPELGSGDGLPKRMLRAVLGWGDPGGEVAVVAVFGRGEDAGDEKLAVSRRQLDTLELDRRRRWHDERCRSAGIRRLWRRHGVEECEAGERGAESSEGGRSLGCIMDPSPFNIRARGPGDEGETGVRGRERCDVGEGASQDVRTEWGGVATRGSGVVIALPSERAAAI